MSIFMPTRDIIVMSAFYTLGAFTLMGAPIMAVIGAVLTVVIGFAFFDE